MTLEIFKKCWCNIKCFSSTTIDAIKYNVPVINFNKFINWDKDLLKTKKVGPNAKLGAIKGGIEPRNIDELIGLLKKNKKYLLVM